MSDVSYGSKAIGLSTRDMDQSEAVQPGGVYEATFAVSGVRTIIPGWENDAINQVESTISSNGGQVTYVSISGDNVVVQWTQLDQATSANMHAAVVPIIIGMIIFAIIVALGIWLILTLTGSVKEISGILTDSPVTTTVVYGCLALGALVAVGYIMKQRSSG
jgi:hypothetical protein